jgi:hypothetical protein
VCVCCCLFFETIYQLLEIGTGEDAIANVQLPSHAMECHLVLVQEERRAQGLYDCGGWEENPIGWHIDYFHLLLFSYDTIDCDFFFLSDCVELSNRWRLSVSGPWTSLVWFHITITVIVVVVVVVVVVVYFSLFCSFFCFFLFLFIL